MRYGAPWVTGALVYGDADLGVLGSVIRATTGTGPNGAGILYNDWDSSADDSKLFRALVLSGAPAGAFFYEDGSFSIPAGTADGTYSVSYRLFVDGADLGTSTATITVGAGGDTSPPTLTSPTAAATGQSTASGSVTTNEANGTLYRLASVNPAEAAATVKAAALTQPVSAAGPQPVSFASLTAATTYYPHFVQVDAAGNESAVASGASFATQAAPAPAPAVPQGSRRLTLAEMLRGVT